MDYYIDANRRSATFTLLDVKNQSPRPQGRPSGRKLAKVIGTQKGFEPLTLKNNPQPGYEIITINGVTEVIEHRRMEPIFYITDDPAVLSELAVSGRH